MKVGSELNTLSGKRKSGHARTAEEKTGKMITTDQVLKLVQQASDQLHAKADNTRTFAAFFDYEKAYDKVWRDGLIHKMLEMEIPMKFIRYTRHFLSGRNTRVEVNGRR